MVWNHLVRPIQASLPRFGWVSANFPSAVFFTPCGVASMSTASGQGPRYTYDHLISNDKLKKDNRQDYLITKLNTIYEKIVASDFDNQVLAAPSTTQSSPLSFFKNLFGSRNESTAGTQDPDTESIRGLYVHGGVGSGKTAMMDIFFNELPIQKKRRVHFHAFMLEVHARLHQIINSTIQSPSLDQHVGSKYRSNVMPTGGLERPKSSVPGGGLLNSIPGHRSFTSMTGAGMDHCLDALADQLISETRLLCFDEMQVTDVGDAMIIRRLFEPMFDRGLVMVATSNRSPDDLYQNGLQRDLFIPFIDRIHRHCDIIDMASPVDYRELQLSESVSADGKLHNHGSVIKPAEVFFHPITESTRASMNILFSQLSNMRPVAREEVHVMGRVLSVDRASNGVAFVNFDWLCNRPVGAVDYIALCKRFHTIFVENVPLLNDRAMRMQTRRWITFIDEVYEHKVKLVCSSSDNVQGVFRDLMNAPVDEHAELTPAARLLMDDLKISHSSSALKSSIFTGEDERFSFRRTMSRLNEMQTSNYWELDHIDE